ncbi:MAG: TRAP transporter substrate-binding protein [Melioribacteraceae bacterium]|nr:TRAP transporter substrate-binding protein [Melioribacteraceae bacterium]
MYQIKRKDFIKKAAVALGGTSMLVAACGKENSDKTIPAVNTGKTFEWRMVTTWLPHFPILGEGADRLAKNIETMSNGRIKIHVFGGGELVPPLETFDAVSQGVAQLGHSASYYWAGKAPSSQLFTSIPFGMNSQKTYAWLYFGGGLELWNELYSNFNITIIPAGNTSGQMGGWFNKEISSVTDLKGLKMRIPGIGGKIISKAGASAVLSPGSEIYTNLERGVIDATEWIGPYHDFLMGFHKIAKYYYYPSFAEPTGVLELLVNKTAFEELPNELKEIVKHAAGSLNISMLAEFDTKNAEYLARIKNKSKVEIKQFPDDVIGSFKKYADEALQELADADPFSKKVLDSYGKFRKDIAVWTDIADKNFS